MILWGIGLGARAIMRAVVANMIGKNMSGTAYGMLNTFFGVSFVLRKRPDGIPVRSFVVALVVFSVAIQLAAVRLRC